MVTWQVGSAKAKLSAVLQAAADEPQVICRREEPIAVIVGVDTYERSIRKPSRSISQMLDELREIQVSEEVEIVIPPRADRPLPEID